VYDDYYHSYEITMKLTKQQMIQSIINLREIQVKITNDGSLLITCAMYIDRCVFELNEQVTAQKPPTSINSAVKRPTISLHGSASPTLRGIICS
jgi:hypothetical protein